MSCPDRDPADWAADDDPIEYRPIPPKRTFTFDVEIRMVPKDTYAFRQPREEDATAPRDELVTRAGTLGMGAGEMIGSPVLTPGAAQRGHTPPFPPESLTPSSGRGCPPGAREGAG